MPPCEAQSFPLEPAACAPIAQLVEHVIRNDGVGGSIPSRGTTTFNHLRQSRRDPASAEEQGTRQGLPQALIRPADPNGGQGDPMVGPDATARQPEAKKKHWSV